MNMYKSNNRKDVNMDQKISTIFAPINLGICPDGNIDRKFSNFYIERSGKGIDLTYIGNVAIDKQYRTNNFTPLLLKENKDEWEYLIEQIRKNGSLVGIQLGCRFYSENAIQRITNIDKERKINEIINFITSTSTHEIDNIINLFVKQAKIAIDLGFDYIQIHAAHGYFLSLLLSPSLNRRNDKYNCSDCLFIHEIIEGIRKYSENIKLDLRISLIEGILNEEDEFNQKLSILKRLATFRLNMISLSNGIYDITKNLIYPSLNKGFYPMQKYEDRILMINKNINWNFCGNINKLEYIKKLSDKKHRSLSIGRSLIADPFFLVNTEESSSNCNGCNKCHYYTRGTTGLSCPIYEKKYKMPLLR